MTDWVSVDDSLPEPSVDVLVSSEGIVAIARRWAITGQWLSCDPRISNGSTVSHWAEITDLPKGE